MENVFNFERYRQYLHADRKACTKIGDGLEAVFLENVWSVLLFTFSPQQFYSGITLWVKGWVLAYLHFTPLCRETFVYKEQL